MLEILKDVLMDTLLDSLKILPFLFISYLIIEFIEHKSSEKLEKALSTSGKYSKVIGSILGIIPQCGFSAVAANLFSNRVITMGTLIAVFLSKLFSKEGYLRKIYTYSFAVANFSFMGKPTCSIFF